MLIDNKTAKTILGINEEVSLTAEEMAKELKITFFPSVSNDQEIIDFGQELKKAFSELGVKIIPFEEAQFNIGCKKNIRLFFKVILVNILVILNKIGLGFIIHDQHIKNLNFPFWVKFGKKLKKGIGIICLGEGKTGDLPMDNTISFKENPIITVLKKNPQISDNDGYIKHMDEAVQLFAWHMTNLVITVGGGNWTIYSFNGSHPTFSLKNNFKEDILKNLIPKIAAPVKPPRLHEFIINPKKFDVNASNLKPYIEDLVRGGAELAKTNLYPKRKSINDLNFRNNFYRWVGSIHLDKRSGMSYGFVARQLPCAYSKLIEENDAKEKFKNDFGKNLIFKDEEYFVLLNIYNKKYYLKLPEVWVIMSKSGSDKSNLNIKTDIIKIGLKNGQMLIEIPKDVIVKEDYRPSFDTRVILAHALGSAIMASVIDYFKPNWKFPENLKNSGSAIVHWHGIINKELIPKGWVYYGINNPSVSCSSAQSAIYAFTDKEEEIINCIRNDFEYKGDIQIEPHHGINMIYGSIQDLATFILSHPNFSYLK